MQHNSQAGHSHHVRGSVATLALALVGALSACTDLEAPVLPEAEKTVVISVDDAPRAVFLGELYRQALERQGREAVLEVTEESSLHRLSTGHADLTLTCAGNALQELNPALAEELAQEYNGVVTAEWRERTYAALMGSLGDNMDATDPSNAQACEADFLPQNLVPVYRSPVIGRPERSTINVVSGSLSTMDEVPPHEEIPALLDRAGV
ncbi:hypothetical protein NQ015_03715 [Corynebacterium sp. 153RC1]|uniref:hypothetical protein n=1 Tax=unclassified Corynebacterium TaxID=2624378 RepID=UPI00211C48C6|nr:MULTISPECIES: hypothetical protein [unclassified Corynebacterium]MCQ9351979.1 hypothetical protein [Corynebacterium sp. 209RC1]MCQ9353728.1 hypothetical protein [Corynebacterium sp. 1222RC1]MCQ9356288.1 hypothetical protein [Corynebacterium sp. 122RC1]MCQ9358390.1 hypothetical protein [Corynebacterium sp. 142RC1]MCQ9360875.1 hypothetical protein [Corynebacterium sp. 153RC1]